MHYWPEDVAYFLRAAPYLRFRRRADTVRWLERQLEAGEECASALAQYPGLRIEPLEFFYLCLRSLAALSSEFLEDLTVQFNWRGTVWGAWLAILEPRSEWAALLQRIEATPESRWLLGVALALLEGRTPDPEDLPLVAVVDRIRRILAPLPRPRMPLRSAPAPAEVAQLEQERETVRAAYRTSGLEGARRVIPGTLLAFYSQDYPRWLRSLERPDGKGPRARTAPSVPGASE